MPINFIPNDPNAGSSAPGMRTQSKRPNRPARRAGFTFVKAPPEGTFSPGTNEFLFWQTREAALAALDAWEGTTGPFKRWQGNRKKLALLPDAGIDINAFYDRSSFSFFHRQIETATVFSGASTDVVSHEVGHGLLDSIRPDLWDVPFLETGAFHEAFGDCVAILTALSDLQTRQKFLSTTANLQARNFVESTAENLSGAIRRLVPTHNAAEPRHAFNTLQFQIPETLPEDGGPGAFINEVHSFGMIFSGCFYSLVSNMFAAMAVRDDTNLLVAAQAAMRVVVEGAKVAPIVPRFMQSVGRSMVLADQQINNGTNRDSIRDAFQQHGIHLGANAMLAPTAALVGAAPKGAKPALAASTRKDLLARLGSPDTGRLQVAPAKIFGERLVSAIHERDIELGALDKRLKGVKVMAPEAVFVGGSGQRAAIVGRLPEPIATESEVHSFVRSLLAHDRIAFAAPSKGSLKKISGGDVSAGVTHQIRTVGGKKKLQRIRFFCCGA